MDLATAYEVLAKQLPELKQAAMPTKPDVFVCCGPNARTLHDAIETVLTASGIMPDKIVFT